MPPPYQTAPNSIPTKLGLRSVNNLCWLRRIDNVWWQLKIIDDDWWQLMRINDNRWLLITKYWLIWWCNYVLITYTRTYRQTTQSRLKMKTILSKKSRLCEASIDIVMKVNCKHNIFAGSIKVIGAFKNVNAYLLSNAITIKWILTTINNFQKPFYTAWVQVEGSTITLKYITL